MPCDSNYFIQVDIDNRSTSTHLSKNYLHFIILERHSLTVGALAFHATDPGSNPDRADDVFN